MTHPDRRPGCLYVVLDDSRGYICTEDRAGVQSKPGAYFSDGPGTHVLEFPDPAAHAALEAELREARAQAQQAREAMKNDMRADGLTWRQAAAEYEREQNEALSDRASMQASLAAAGAAHAALDAESKRYYAESCEIAVRLGEQRQRAEKAEAAHAAAVEALEAGTMLYRWANRVLWVKTDSVEAWSDGSKDVMRSRSTSPDDWIEFGKAIEGFRAALAGKAVQRG